MSKTKQTWCAHCLIDDWVDGAKTGLLFPKINTDGSVKMKSRWTAKDFSGTLRTDLQSFDLYEGETPHSFGHGGIANSLKQGKSLEETMYLAFMKNVRTAETYSRGLRVLYPNFGWKDVGIGTQQSPIDENTLMKYMLNWKAFSECKPL